MPRLSAYLYTCLVPVLATACQATVNVTEATETDTDSGDGGNADTNAAETGMCAVGDEGCPCYGNGTCNGNLECNEALCQPPPGETGSSTGKPTDDSTGGTISETTADTSGPISGDTGSESSGNMTADASTSSPGDTSTGSPDDTSTSNSDDTSSSSGDDTGGNAGCGNVPSDMVCVPADTFEMGTSLNIFLNQQIYPSEKPAHMVTVSKTYWIDKTEVTVEDYALCWANQICELPPMGQDYNWGVMNKEKYPANGVNWHQAKAYCEWKGKRLPTEAEWELAARGTDGRMFPWGDDTPTCMHVVNNQCGTFGSQKVGSKPLGASPYGALDMAGNILEWCSDYYKEDFYYESPAVDPTGPGNGTLRVLRSYMPPFVSLVTMAAGRSTYRSPNTPLEANPWFGFRCARTAP